MFNFSEKFLNEYLPTTIELGRSFVTLEYQSTRRDSKGLFALDNLWDGLGALTVVMPNVKYFFGKVTMYPSYIRKGRDMILYFLKKHFADKDSLITPMKPLQLESDENELATLFCKDTFKEDYKIFAVDEILAEKRIRHIQSFIENEPESCNLTSGANKIFFPSR